MPDAITIREVPRLLWEADCYPRIGNADWPTADRMEAEALKKAESAMPLPDDPPEFAVWLEALRSERLPGEEREEIYWAMHDYFGRTASA